MNYIAEYIAKGLHQSVPRMEKELREQIKIYNAKTGRYLLVFSTSFSRSIPECALGQDDYYVIHDMLKDKAGNHKSVDVYIETPGGSGETAEEIVRFLHQNFETVSFVVCGEAKSAGTIIVLSGNEILMTETGSLGPIDAQVRIGRSFCSAYDYIEWVDETRQEAEKQKHLNPFDATMVAQISPGELKWVMNAQEFAKELVTEWLAQYKFKTWEKTRTRGIEVTEEMKRDRAADIVKELAKHSKWRSCPGSPGNGQPPVFLS